MTPFLKNFFLRKSPKPNKYHAQRTSGYASSHEANRAFELHALADKGEITDLHEQFPFELIPEQTDATGKAVRPCFYYADFVYTDKDGHTVVEDAKGFRTDVYKLKKKLMLLRYGITIKEV